MGNSFLIQPIFCRSSFIMKILYTFFIIIACSTSVANDIHTLSDDIYLEKRDSTLIVTGQWELSSGPELPIIYADLHSVRVYCYIKKNTCQEQIANIYTPP